MTSTQPPSIPAVDWTRELVFQLDWHWTQALRPRLQGLTDEEYLWEPVPGSWSVRRRGESDAMIQGGSGDMIVEFAYPEPQPTPVTTIAWRLAHLIVGVLGARNAARFGGPAADYITWEYAATADHALAQLDAAYDRWIGGVRTLTLAELAEPCGEEGPYEQETTAALVLHITREVIHHGAEIALLRDLFAHR